MNNGENFFSQENDEKMPKDEFHQVFFVSVKVASVQVLKKLHLHKSPLKTFSKDYESGKNLSIMEKLNYLSISEFK